MTNCILHWLRWAPSPQSEGLLGPTLRIVEAGVNFWSYWLLLEGFFCCNFLVTMNKMVVMIMPRPAVRINFSWVDLVVRSWKPSLVYLGCYLVLSWESPAANLQICSTLLLGVCKETRTKGAEWVFELSSDRKYLLAISFDKGRPRLGERWRRPISSPLWTMTTFRRPITTTQ